MTVCSRLRANTWIRTSILILKWNFSQISMPRFAQVCLGLKVGRISKHLTVRKQHAYLQEPVLHDPSGMTSTYSNTQSTPPARSNVHGKTNAP
jgi:hypothetical protein